MMALRLAALVVLAGPLWAFEPGSVPVFPPWNGPAPVAVPKFERPKDALAAGDDKERYLAILDQRVEGLGAATETVDEVRTLYWNALVGLDVSILSNLANNNARLVVIPADKKLTDLPEFMELQDQHTFDGRLWENVRGMTRWRLGLRSGWGWAVAVPEENLRGDGAYPRNYVFFHEFGHEVWDFGLHRRASSSDCALCDRVTAIYRDSMERPEKTGLGAYADSNEQEFFAQATAFYFGVGERGQTVETLRANNPEMYDVVRAIYGEIVSAGL